MRVLLTGGAGFIGRHVLAELLEAGPRTTWSAPPLRQFPSSICVVVDAHAV